MSEDIETPNRSQITRRKDVMLALVAVGTLIVGVLVYVLDRGPDSVYFLSPNWSLAEEGRLWFGSLGGQLPEFAHVYSFSLLTGILWATCPGSRLLSCGAWWMIDSLFELGQHPAFGPVIAAALPAWLQGAPLLENTGPYFTNGTFDPLDLVAIMVGALAAYCTISLMYIRHEEHRYVESS